MGAVCTTRDSVDINFVGPPVVDFGPDTILCENASLLLDVTTPNAVYLWHDNSTDSVFTVNQVGTYWVEVSENGCVGTDTINVDYQIIQNDLGNDTTICQGETVTFDATFSGSTYLWQDGSTDSVFAASQSGVYWVEVTQNNCSKVDSVSVTVIPLPTGNLGNDTTLCPGEKSVVGCF